MVACSKKRSLQEIVALSMYVVTFTLISSALCASAAAAARLVEACLRLEIARAFKDHNKPFSIASRPC